MRSAEGPRAGYKGHGDDILNVSRATDGNWDTVRPRCSMGHHGEQQEAWDEIDELFVSPWSNGYHAALLTTTSLGNYTVRGQLGLRDLSVWTVIIPPRHLPFGTLPFKLQLWYLVHQSTSYLSVVCFLRIILRRNKPCPGYEKGTWCHRTIVICPEA